MENKEHIIHWLRLIHESTKDKEIQERVLQIGDYIGDITDTDIHIVKSSSVGKTNQDLQETIMETIQLLDKPSYRDNITKLIPTENKAPEHYDNSNGSLYKFATDHDLDAYQFDIIKRIVRCKKKGNWKQDLEKTKFVIDLYLKEFDLSK